jgi:hypothetical protein
MHRRVGQIQRLAEIAKQLAIDDLDVRPIDNQRGLAKNDQRTPTFGALSLRPQVRAIKNEEQPAEPDEKVMRTGERVIDEPQHGAHRVSANPSHCHAFEKFTLAVALLSFQQNVPERDARKGKRSPRENAEVPRVIVSVDIRQD